MSAIVENFDSMRHKLGDAFEHMGHSIGKKLGVFETSGTILVTGATGVIGYRVATRLLNAGYPTVRVGVTNLEKGKEFKEKGAEIVEFCWDREETYEKALDGVTSVLCTTPFIKGWVTQFPIFLKSCQNKGVHNFVKVSFYHAKQSGNPFHDVPLVKLHGVCDELLEDSGIPYTILAATHFMSNPLKYQGKEIRRNKLAAIYYGASMTHGVNYVSPNDVAEVATRVLLNPKSHHGKTYTLTGPKVVMDKEVADLLGKQLSIPVMYFEKPIDFFETTEKHPVWMVHDLVALERIKASGKEDYMKFISRDIQKLCGHRAETFEEYLNASERMSPQELE